MRTLQRSAVTGSYCEEESQQQTPSASLRRIRPCCFEGHCIIHSYLQHWAQNGLFCRCLLACKFSVVKMWQYLGWDKIYLKEEINTVIRKDIFGRKLGLFKSVLVISSNQPSPENTEFIPTTETSKLLEFYRAKAKWLLYWLWKINCKRGEKGQRLCKKTTQRQIHLKTNNPIQTLLSKNISDGLHPVPI